MTNETISVQVPLGAYLELAFQLRHSDDTRQPDEVVAFALKAWLSSWQGDSHGGYQWKTLFLPDGAELRMRFHGVDYYAKVENDKLRYAGETASPRSWALMVTGTVRNPWRDIWKRRSINECWTRASMWRSASSYSPALLNSDRRRHARRMSD